MTKKEPAVASQPGATRKGSATRARILEEARRLLVEKGHDGLVLREVAGNCAVQLGTLQYYFPSHEDLVVEIVEAEAVVDIETIEEAIEQDLPDEDRVRLLAVTLITRWRGESGVVFSILLLLSLRNERFRSLRDGIYGRFYDALIAAIKQVRPGLRKGEYELRSRLMTSLIDGAAMQINVGTGARFMDRVVEEACSIALSEPARH